VMSFKPKKLFLKKLSWFFLDLIFGSQILIFVIEKLLFSTVKFKFYVEVEMYIFDYNGISKPKP